MCLPQFSALHSGECFAVCYLHLVQSGSASTSWPRSLGQASPSARRVPKFQKGTIRTLQVAKDPPKAYVGAVCRRSHQMCRYWDVTTVRGTREPVGHASQPVYQRGGLPTSEHRSDHLECDGHASLATGPCPDACPRPRPRLPMAGRDGAGLQASLFLPGTCEGTAIFLYRVGGFTGIRHSFLGAECLPQGGAPARNSS